MLVRAILLMWLTMSVGPWIRFTYFYGFVRRYLRQNPKPLILDAGFGAGEHIGWIALYLPEATIIGYDTADGNTYKDNLKKTQRWVKSNNIKLQLQDLKTMTDTEKFDAIYCVEVLEHIPNNELVLHNIYTALKPNGLFYLAMPYHKDRPTLLPRQWFRQFYDWAEEEHTGEMRSLQETQQLLENIGFKTLEAQYTFGFYGGLVWEIEHFIRTLPFGRTIVKMSHAFFNTIALGEFIFPKPKDGNLRLVVRK